MSRCMPFRLRLKQEGVQAVSHVIELCASIFLNSGTEGECGGNYGEEKRIKYITE